MAKPGKAIFARKREEAATTVEDGYQEVRDAPAHQ